VVVVLCGGHGRMVVVMWCAGRDVVCWSWLVTMSDSGLPIFSLWLGPGPENQY